MKATPDPVVAALMRDLMPGDNPIFAALIKVMSEVGTIKKEGTNEFHKYAYAKAADVLFRLQRILVANDINIVKTEIKRDLIADGEALAISYRFAFVHADGWIVDTFWDDETPLVFTGMSSCRNSKGGFDDKCANKCSTAATKYFLIDFFKIPTGDYDDADHQEDRPARPKAPASRSADRREERSREATPPRAIPHDGVKTLEWAVEFLAAINAASSTAEIDEWSKLNIVPLNAITVKGGPLAKRVEDGIVTAYATLGNTKH